MNIKLLWKIAFVVFLIFSVVNAQKGKKATTAKKIKINDLAKLFGGIVVDKGIKKEQTEPDFVEVDEDKLSQEQLRKLKEKKKRKETQLNLMESFNVNKEIFVLVMVILTIEHSMENT